MKKKIMQKEGMKFTALLVALACLTITIAGYATENLFIFFIGLLTTAGTFIYIISEIYKKAMIAVAFFAAIFLLFVSSSNATIITYDFESDIVGSDPTEWTISESTDTNVQVYDDAGNKRCFLYDNNASHFKGCSMYRSFASSMITEDINFTFEIKIDRNTSCYFKAALVGGVEELTIAFWNGSIYASSYEETAHILGQYQINSWMKITAIIHTLNSTYMVTDYTNTVWGSLDPSYAGINITFFSTDSGDSSLTDNMLINASIDNIIIKWGEYETNLTVTTEDATLIDWNEATLNGYLHNPDNETNVLCGFQIGTFPGDYDQTINVAYLSSSGNFSYKITDLDELTTYYYRTYAVKGDITVYGEEKSFTTCSRYGYHEDQYYDHNGGDKHWITQYSSCKQTFIPSVPILTNISIYIARSPIAPNAPLSISIVNDSGTLRSTQIYPHELTDEFSWYEWDFEDLFVDTSSEYAILLESDCDFINNDGVATGYYWWGNYGCWVEPVNTTITIVRFDVPEFQWWYAIQPLTFFLDYWNWLWNYEPIYEEVNKTDYVVHCGETYYDYYVRGYFAFNSSLMQLDGLIDAYFKTYGRSIITAVFDYEYSNLSVSVNATNSTSNPGNITYYQWDWDGDEIYDDEGMIANHTYSESGIYNITLKIVNEFGDWYTVTTSLELKEGASGSGNVSSTTPFSEGDGGGNNVDDNDNDKDIWKLPFSWFAIFIMIAIGVIGMSLSAFFLKPESIKALGYAPAAGTMLITVFTIIAILLYHADVEWYWIIIDVALIFFILFITVKILVMKKKKVAKSIFRIKKKNRKKRRRR